MCQGGNGPRDTEDARGREEPEGAGRTLPRSLWREGGSAEPGFQPGDTDLGFRPPEVGENTSLVF